jgi:N-acylneuraminate cytidylyltransferase
MKKVTAIVPVKKHSERVPFKNFRDFNGKPLYHWIIDTLIKTAYVDEIIINTDSVYEIKRTSDFPNVMLSERPKKLKGDFVSMNKIIEYEVTKHDSDIFIQTHCTNPLLKSKTINAGIERFESQQETDSLLTVTKHQKMYYDNNFEPINHDPHDLIRTQDLPPIYENNSNMFVFTEDTLEKTGGRVGLNPAYYEIDDIESIDIDTESDYELAQYFHKKQNLY